MTSVMTSRNFTLNESTTALRFFRNDSPQDLILRPGLGSPRLRCPKPRRKPLSSFPVPVRVGKTTLNFRTSIMLLGCTMNYIESDKIVNR